MSVLATISLLCQATALKPVKIKDTAVSNVIVGPWKGTK